MELFLAYFLWPLIAMIFLFMIPVLFVILFIKKMGDKKHECK
jgi:Na+/proline symporter